MKASWKNRIDKQLDEDERHKEALAEEAERDSEERSRCHICHRLPGDVPFNRNGKALGTNPERLRSDTILPSETNLAGV